MESHRLAEYMKSFATIAMHSKFPVNLLVLYGKTLNNPHSTFSNSNAYQIRNSPIDELPEIALLLDVSDQSQQQKHILQQVCMYNVVPKVRNCLSQQLPFS